MTEIEELLERQSECQRRRRDMTWREKISLPEKIRHDARRLRALAQPSEIEHVVERSGEADDTD